MHAITGATARYCCVDSESFSSSRRARARVTTCCSSSSSRPDSPSPLLPKKKMHPASTSVDVVAAALAAAALSDGNGTESAAATPRFHQHQQRDGGGGSCGPALVVFSGGTAFNSVAGRINRLTTRVSYVLPVSDDGGSTAEIARVLGGPAVGDIRSRCLRLADADAAPEARAVARLLAHRLPSSSSSSSSSPASSASSAKSLAREDWRRVVEGTHPLWTGVSEPYKHLIRSFLVHFHSEVLRAPLGATFDWRGGSVGNFFFAGARLFFRSLEAAAFLFCRVARAPEGAAVLPAVATESALALAAVLEDGSVLVGQNEISHPSSGRSPGARGGSISRACSSSAVEGASDDGGAVGVGGGGGATSGEDDDEDDDDDDYETPSPAAVDKESPAARAPLPSPVSRIFYLPPDDGGRHVAWEAGGGGGGGGGGDAAANATATASPPRRESSSAGAAATAAASLVAEVFPAPNPRVLAALGAAEGVVYGMGSLYTSIAPSLILEGVGEAVAAVRGPKVLLLNGSLDRETSLAPSSAASAAAASNVLSSSGSANNEKRRPMAASDIAAAIAAAARRERGVSSSSSSSSSSNKAGVSSASPSAPLSSSNGKSSSSSCSSSSDSRNKALDISPFVTTVLAPEGGEVEFDAARLLEMGVTRARTVRSRRGSGGRVEFDPDALVAALAEEVSAWRAANAEEGENAL